MDRSKASSTALAPRSSSSLGDPDGGIDWERTLWAIRRRKLLLLLIVLLGSGLGVLASRSFEPTYFVESRIWIDNPVVRGPDLGPIRSANLLETNAWMELLRSYRVLDDVVRDHRLYLVPENGADPRIFAGFGIDERVTPGEYSLEMHDGGERLRLRSERGETLDEVAPGDSIGRAQGFLWAPVPDALPPGDRIRFTVRLIRDAAFELGRTLEPAMDPQGNFLRVGLRGTDPDRLAAVLDAVVYRFVEVAAELKSTNLVERTVILEEQLEAARAQLETADRALESFRTAAITLPGDAGGGPVATGSAGSSGARNSFFDLNLQRDELERTRSALLRSLASSDVGQLPVETLEGVPLVQESGELSGLLAELTEKRGELRALRYRYSDEHPEVQLVLRDIAALETRLIPEAIERMEGELATRVAEMDQLIQARSGALQAIPARALEEARRSRDMALAEALYTTLQQRYEEARLAEASLIPDIRVLDAPVAPTVPESNPGPRIMLLAMLGSLGLGMAGVLVVDRSDQRVRYPREITQGMGLNILGAIPKVRQRRGKASEAAAREAFRSLCLNLSHSYGSAGPMLVAITSPDIGDGKSFIAANLGGALARQGWRTIVIDGDARRGTQHLLLEGDRRPGLTDYLEGEVELEAAIRSVQGGGLDFIPSGTRRETAPELLNSRRMRSLLSHLKSSYDVILIDTPPLRAGADALVLSTLAGHMLFVLRTGVTDREIAGTNLDMLDQLPVRVLGAVLNDVSTSSGVFEGYSYLPYDYLPEERERAGEVSRLASMAAPTSGT